MLKGSFSVQNHFGLVFSISVVILLLFFFVGEWTAHLLLYYDYNEQSNGILSCQNYVTFDFDGNNSIKMELLSIFPLYSWTFWLLNTADCSEIFVHFPHNGNKITATVIWIYLFNTLTRFVSLHLRSYMNMFGFVCVFFCLLPFFWFHITVWNVHLWKMILKGFTQHYDVNV